MSTAGAVSLTTLASDPGIECILNFSSPCALLPDAKASGSGRSIRVCQQSKSPPPAAEV